ELDRSGFEEHGAAGAAATTGRRGCARPPATAAGVDRAADGERAVDRDLQRAAAVAAEAARGRRHTVAAGAAATSADQEERLGGQIAERNPAGAAGRRARVSAAPARVAAAAAATA